MPKERMKAYIVYSDYSLQGENTQIELYGRLENGQSFVSLHSLKPYLFIKKADLHKAKPLLEKFETEETKLTDFSQDSVVKISSPNYQEINKLRDALNKKEIEHFEADIKPDRRFLMDNDILGSIEISGDYEPSEKIDRVYRNAKLKPINYQPELKIVSLDIESDKDTGDLYCIGMYSKDYKKNFVVSNKELKNAVSCKTEAICLEKFKSEILKLDPDIIIGWNIIDFDLSYLKERFEKNKIPFDLGRSNRPCSLRIQKSFFRSSTADFPGRQVLDCLDLIQDPFLKEAPSIKNAEFESYSLEDVSQEILGEGKLIKGKDRHDEITRLYKKDPQKVIDYNLQDCKLVLDILEKIKIIPLALERAQLTGMSLDKLTASVASFDSLYIREARKRGFVSPSLHFTEKEEKIKGGYVQQTNPGIYHNVLVFDFKSLYPSILKTFNMDPSAMLEKKERDSLEVQGVYFRNNSGILPEIIGKLHQARELAKKEKRELSSYAIKTIMNSFWGVLASPNCRYFNMKMANAITGQARFIIQLTAKEIEKRGYKVIYSDTDSCFIETKLGKDKANALGKEIQDEINDFYKKYVKENYHRDSYLELQFQKQFLSFMIPSIRSKPGKEDEEAKGAKKRYAGLVEENGKEKVVVVGLEAIRGDWVEAAQEFQIELLDKLFHNEEVAKFIKDYIKKIKSGKLDSKLIYRKSIRKNLNEYTKTTPPHVKAARLLEHLDSNIIQYYITTEGPEPIQNLKHKIDYEHYIEKQIKPIAEQILSLLGKTFEDLEDSKQSKLF